MSEDALEYLAEVGVGIEHSQDGERRDGEKGDCVAGPAVHGICFKLEEWR